MKINNKVKAGITAAIIAGALCIGGTVAYLTDNEKAVNEFTVGKIDIELQEPNWNPQDNTTLVPLQEIRKDPQVKNIGINDAFVYLEVSIPVKNVITADENGNRLPSKETELFQITPSGEWTLIQSEKVGEEQKSIYSYNKILKNGETTAPLFEKMIFANIIEGQLDAQKLSVPVNAYAIQSSNTGGTTGTVPEQAKTAFQKYLNQNKGKAS